MRKTVIAVAMVAAVLIIGLGRIASEPVVVRSDGVPVHFLEAVESQAKGLYSRSLPLIPVYVSVERFTDCRIEYTIHYFPFGTVGMSYIEGDGYNIEKPLG